MGFQKNVKIKIKNVLFARRIWSSEECVRQPSRSLYIQTLKWSCLSYFKCSVRVCHYHAINETVSHNALLNFNCFIVSLFMDILFSPSRLISRRAVRGLDAINPTNRGTTGSFRHRRANVNKTKGRKKKFNRYEYDIASSDGRTIVR